MSWGSDTNVMVTGASSGIGEELARVIARDGHDLVLVARSAERLASVASALRGSFGVDAVTIAADLSSADGVRSVLEEIERRDLRIDILVNNAGVGTWGRFVDVDLERQMEMIRLNVMAVTELTGHLIGPMVRRGSGGVLNVASTAAFQPGPLMAVYYATKAYVLSFTEALASELEGSGVTVTALCPGPTPTAFQERAGMESVPLARASRLMPDAAAVAETGWTAFRRERVVVVPGLTNKLLASSVRVTPRPLVRRIVRAIQGKRGET